MAGDKFHEPGQRHFAEFRRVTRRNSFFAKKLQRKQAYSFLRNAIRIELGCKFGGEVYRCRRFNWMHFRTIARQRDFGRPNETPTRGINGGGRETRTPDLRIMRPSL